MNTSGLLILFWVSLAGGIGAVLRLLASSWQGKLPWGILAVNSVASAILGWFISADTYTLYIVSAFAGGLSTFSSFAGQTSQFLTSGKRARGLANIALNLVVPSTAVLLGALLSGALLN
jgi:CrcB protein